MKTKELIEEGLKKKGFDGLFNADLECGCVLGDLEPCGNIDLKNCAPGNIIKCDCERCDFHVGEKA